MFYATSGNVSNNFAMLGKSHIHISLNTPTLHQIVHNYETPDVVDLNVFLHAISFACALFVSFFPYVVEWYIATVTHGAPEINRNKHFQRWKIGTSEGCGSLTRWMIRTWEWLLLFNSSDTWHSCKVNLLYFLFIYFY